MDIKKGLDYKEYLNSSLVEYKEKQLKIEKFIKLQKNVIKKLKTVKEKIDILIFAEIYCPDCREVMAVINEIKKYADINLYIFPRKENETEMTKLFGEAKIPTLVRLNENEKIIGEPFIEFSDEFKKKLEGKSLDEMKEEIYQYRRGKYNNLIVNEIMDKILFYR